MKRTNYRLFIISIALFAIIIAVTGCGSSKYDWDNDVRQHLSKYNCDFELIDSSYDSDSNITTYSYKTNDERSIAFEITCFYGDANSPFGFSVPVTVRKITDNFPEKICDFVSENYGSYDIAGKTIDEISSYILDTIDYSDALLKSYGIETFNSSISFQLSDGENVYSLKYGNHSESILRDKLLELLH